MSDQTMNNKCPLTDERLKELWNAHIGEDDYLPILRHVATEASGATVGETRMGWKAVKTWVEIPDGHHWVDIFDASGGKQIGFAHVPWEADIPYLDVGAMRTALSAEGAKEPGHRLCCDKSSAHADENTQCSTPHVCTHPSVTAPAGREGALRKLIHSAYHLIDDSEENAQTGVISIDNEIGVHDLRELRDALDELEIDSHEAIDQFFALTRHVEAANSSGAGDVAKQKAEVLSTILSCLHQPNPTDLAVWMVRPGHSAAFSHAVSVAAGLNSTPPQGQASGGEDKRDAERYRKLRSHFDSVEVPTLDGGFEVRLDAYEEQGSKEAAERLDAAIDTLRATSKGDGE